MAAMAAMDPNPDLLKHGPIAQPPRLSSVFKVELWRRAAIEGALSRGCGFSGCRRLAAKGVAPGSSGCHAAISDSCTRELAWGIIFNTEYLMTTHPMRSYPEHHIVTSAEQLASLLDEVGAAARLKEVSFLHPHYRALIEASPFAVLATSGRDGLDASPRGDLPGFVVVEDEKTLLLPERRGNNRADSLHNIISDPRVALLFLIPGVGETLRVNGKASILVAPDLLTRFAVDGREPKCVISIEVDTVFFQCARAILRSKLWESASAVHRAGTIPSAGTMLAAFAEGQIDSKAYDDTLLSRQLGTLS